MSSAADGPVGLLGTGLMGTAMARRLLDQDVSVVAWDREPDHVQPLAARGAEVAASAAEVLGRAQAVITMLPTAEIVLTVVEPLLDEWPEQTIWLQMSSVGAPEADRLAQIAAAHGVTMFDAPVVRQHSSRGGGRADDPRVRLGVRPRARRTGLRGARLEGAVGRRGGMGSRLKLAANHWMIAMVAALAETMHLCQLMGLEQKRFVDLLDGGPLGSSYGVGKLAEMRQHEYPAGFPVRLALKDLKLVREVAQGSGVELPLLNTVLARMGEVENTHADDDLAAVY